MYYLQGVDDFIGLDDLGAKAKTSCPVNKILSNGKCITAVQAQKQGVSTYADASATIAAQKAAKTSGTVSTASTAVTKTVVPTAGTGTSYTITPLTCTGNKVYSSVQNKCVAPNSAAGIAATGICPGNKIFNNATSKCVTPAQAAKLGLTQPNVVTGCSDGSQPSATGMCANGTCVGGGTACLGGNVGGCGVGQALCPTTGMCGPIANPCVNTINTQCVAGVQAICPTTGVCGPIANPCGGGGTTLPSYTTCSNGLNVPVGTPCPSGSCAQGQTLCTDGITCVSQGMTCPQVAGGCGPGFSACSNGSCVPLGQTCPTLPNTQCGTGSYLDQNYGSPTYGQCVPTSMSPYQSAMLATGSGAGGGGGGMMPGTDQGAPASSAVSADTAVAAPKKSNMMLYLGIGALAIGGLYLFSKSKKGKR